MTEEEMQELRKKIKREILSEISMNNISLKKEMKDRFDYHERYMNEVSSRVTEIHKGLNIITEKLIDYIIKENKK